VQTWAESVCQFLTESKINMGITEITTAGVVSKVPSAEINGKTVIVTGRWLKVAAVNDERWQEGVVVPEPERFVASVRQRTELGADIFTFSQTITDTSPHYPYFYKLDSVAAIPIISYEDWWNNRVSTDFRCDVRKAAKRGVVVQRVPFSDEFVRSIVEVYDETPTRQGRPFWHYKKSFDAAKRANGTYLEKSDFLGAFSGGELIGFVKIVYVNRIAQLMQILSKNAHRDKRPMSALIAKAVSVCVEHNCLYLTYGQYRYEQGADSVTAFKHRTGFEEILVPRYYVPLTAKGWLAVRLQLYRGVRGFVPAAVLRSLKRIRASVHSQSLLRMRKPI
jgi:hypothetical protein